MQQTRALERDNVRANPRTQNKYWGANALVGRAAMGCLFAWALGLVGSASAAPSVIPVKIEAGPMPNALLSLKALRAIVYSQIFVRENACRNNNLYAAQCRVG